MGRNNFRNFTVIRQSTNTNWKMNAVIFSVILTTLIYVTVSIYVGWDGVVAVFVKVDVWGLLIALALSLVNYGLRFIRWQLYLKHLGFSVPTSESWKIYLSGFALTTTPGKAGEAIRSIFLKKHQVPVKTSLTAFISERLSDLVAIVLLSCIGLLQYPIARIPVILTIIIILCVWCMMLFKQIPDYLNQISKHKTGRIQQILQKIAEIMRQMQRCHSTTMLIITTVISVISWGAEAIAFYLLLQWSGFDVAFSFAIFVYAISMLAGALSFLPGGLGGAEATMISLLLLKNVDAQSAVALTIFIRLTTLWFAVVLGIIAFLQLKMSDRKNV